MLKEKSRDQSDLINKLTRLLKKLNFENIRVNENNYEYSTTSPDFPIPAKEDYTPALIGQKNEVVYCFEFITEELNNLEENKKPLQKIIEIGHQNWDADFVLVTRYGNKEAVRKWCDNINLSVDQIWEV